MNSMSYEYRAYVVKVVDGDTVDFVVDLGFHVKLNIRTRLYGINAPEMNTDAGKAAKAYLQELLPLSYYVQLVTYKDPLDKYGRWLATVQRPGVPRDVNTAMVEDGHAVAKVY